METFRCQICVGVLVDPTVRRCPYCGHNQRRGRPPVVLGEGTRTGANLLPIDRWMIERLQTGGTRRGRRTLPPVAWHGKFTTTPLAEPDFSATPSPVATPFAPPTVVEPAATAPEPRPVPEEPERPATVGALELDAYTRPLAKPTVHAELDPEVRALVDELYEQARAEVSGNDLACFVPVEHDEIVADDPPSSDEPSSDEPETTAPSPPPSGSGWVPALPTQPRRGGHPTAD